MISLEIESQAERWSSEDCRCVWYVGVWVSALALLGVFPGLDTSPYHFYFDPTAYCVSLSARNMCEQSFVTLKSACFRAQSDLAYCQVESLAFMERVNSRCGPCLEEYVDCEQDCEGKKAAARLCIQGVDRPEWLLQPDLARRAESNIPLDR